MFGKELIIPMSRLSCFHTAWALRLSETFAVTLRRNDGSNRTSVPGNGKASGKSEQAMRTSSNVQWSSTNLATQAVAHSRFSMLTIAVFDQVRNLDTMLNEPREAV